MYLGVSLFIAIPIALVNGIWPKNLGGWLLLLVFALPAIVALEWIADKVMSDKVSRALDPKREHSMFSLLRVAYTLVWGIAATGIILIGIHALREPLSGYIVFR